MSSLPQASNASSQSNLTWAAAQSLNFSGAGVQLLTLGGNTTFSSANLTPGKSVTLLVTCDATGRTLSFPAGWVWVGSNAPASILASKKAVLSVYSTGSADAGVIASWAPQF